MYAMTIPAQSATYRDVQPHIEKTVKQFCKRFKILDVEEKLSEAHLIYAEAVRQIPPYADQNFIGWLNLVVWRRLIDNQRQQTLLRREKPPKRKNLCYALEYRPQFDVRAFLAELGHDARICARLAIDEFPSAGNIRAALQHKQWPKWRIKRAFAEIRKALV